MGAVVIGNDAAHREIPVRAGAKWSFGSLSAPQTSEEDTAFLLFSPRTKWQIQQTAA
jgi:hypothetical protein